MLYHGPLFDGEVLVEDGRGERFRVEVEGEGAVLVESGQEDFTAGGHFLGSGGAEHLVDGFGAGVGDGFDFGLGHGHEEQDVAAEQLHGSVDDFGAHGGFGEVGDPENERAAGLEAVERGGGAEVVGFAGFGADQGEGLDELAQVGCAAAGQQSLLDAVAIGQQADAVAGEESELGQGDGGGAGVVELGVGWGRIGCSASARLSRRG